jgi:hypothetical protein
MHNDQIVNGKGEGKVLWWVITGLTSILLGVGSHMLTGSADHSQRIAVLEAQNAANSERLSRIERKLDQLLERK